MDSDTALKAEGLKVRQTKEFVRAAGGGLRWEIWGS